MEDEPRHIVTCTACGGPINLLHPEGWHGTDAAGYRHITPYCNPDPETARERANRLWKISQPQTD